MKDDVFKGCFWAGDGPSCHPVGTDKGACQSGETKHVRHLGLESQGMRADKIVLIALQVTNLKFCQISVGKEGTVLNR